jgi:uncharacterized protein
VHISQIADRYVRDANEVVRVGQRVRVTVQSVDLARGRIALTMRKEQRATPDGAERTPTEPGAGAGRAGAAPKSRDGRTPGGDAGRGGRGAPPSNAPKPKPDSAPVPGKGYVAPNGMRFK